MSLPSGLPSREEFTKRSLEFWKPKIQQMFITYSDAYYDCMNRLFNQHTEPLNLTTIERGSETTIIEEDQSLSSPSDALTSTTVVQPAPASPNQQQAATNLLADNNEQCLTTNISPTAHVETEMESSVPLLAQNSSLPVELLPNTTSTLLLNSTTQHELDLNAAKMQKIVSFATSSPASLIQLDDGDDMFEEILSPPSVEEISVESNHSIDFADFSQEVANEPFEQEIDNDEDNYEVIDQLITEPESGVQADNEIVENHELDIGSYTEKEEEGNGDHGPPRKKMKTFSEKVLPDLPDSEPANNESRLPHLSSIRESTFKINENSAFELVKSQLEASSSAPTSDQIVTISETTQKTLKGRHSSQTSSQQNIIEPKASTSAAASLVSTEVRSDLLNSDERPNQNNNSFIIDPENQIPRRTTFPKDIQQNTKSSTCSKPTSKPLEIEPRPDVVNFINEKFRSETENSNDWYNPSRSKYNDISIIEMKCHQESCNESFSNGNSHRKHMWDAHSRHPYGCPLCNATHTAKPALEKHISVAHKNPEEWYCRKSNCNYKASHWKTLYGHNLFNHEEGAYACTDKDCQFKSNLRVIVSKHNNINHPKIAKASAEKYVRRQASTENDPVFAFDTLYCMTCSEKVDSWKQLNEHNENVHQIKEYPCLGKNCKKSFACKEQLDRHLTSEHKPPFNCDHCSDFFQKNIDLYNHVRFKHQKGRFFCRHTKCSKSSSSFLTRAEVNSHWTEYHAPSYIVKKLHCPIDDCKEEFPFEKNETGFFNHLSEKHNMKKYFCLHENCADSFDKIWEVENHSRSIHTQKNEWRCPECSFKNIKYLPFYFHYRNEHLPGLFSCKELNCGFTGLFRALVNDHYDNVHSGITAENVDR